MTTSRRRRQRVVGHAPQFDVGRLVRSDVCTAKRLDQVGRHHVARPHCDGGNGGDGRGATALPSPIAPHAVVRHRIDEFVVRPILGVLLLLLLLDLICPLPRKAVSDGRFQGQARQAQQRRNVGLADGGGTREDYDQRSVLMSLMRSLLLPWRMSRWSMTSVLCLDVAVVSIQ
jgi:hypothetical protein